MKLLRYILLAAVAISLASCTKKDPEGDPAGTVSLNMLSENNGKTILGGSDVFINKANNFYSRWCFISDAGQAGGIWSDKAPVLDNMVREAAVIPGHLYHVFDQETIFDFPSGVRAVMVDANYYRVYVDSEITSDGNVTGAVVKYLSIYPDRNGLPEYDHKLGEVYYAGDSVYFDLPQDAECFWHDGVPEVFDISTENGELVMTLLRTPTEYNGITGNYGVYMRRGDVFSKVNVRVVRP